ncbi:MAG: sensor histidine kinase [Eubacteriales bacterium]|nr:sensor histidine kinase [Eubacteriales bacterium]
MGKIREKIRNMSIRKKIILYTYLVVTPILLIICICVTGYRYMTTKEEYEEIQSGSVSSLAASLDIIRQDVHSLSLNLAINQQIQDIFTSSSANRLNSDVQLWEHNAPVQFLEEIIALKGYIKTVSIYPENGVFAYLHCIDMTSYQTDIEKIRETALYERALKERGHGFWAYIGKGSSELYQANRGEKLVLCREVFDLSKKEPLGFLTVGISEDTIEGLCGNAIQGEDETVVLFDHYGNKIIAYGRQDEKIRDYIEEKGIPKKASALTEYGGDSYKGLEFFWEGIGSEGWKVCKVMPAKGMWYFFKDIVYIPLVLLLGVSLGMLPLLLFVSNIISKPLENVCIAMGKFRQGDFHQKLEVQSEDEVGMVASCFNQMVVDIDMLIHKNYIMVLKERESELAVLQAQINPHFLYNALDSIYWQATNVGDEETAESIYELSQLFRLVLSQGKDWVTVAMEAELLQRYLEIQKLRFGRLMDFEVNIQEEILEEKIPKLILQPFVENAVIHGGENGDKSYKIDITGRLDGEYMHFEIRDTGAGMTPEQLRRIWEEDTSKVFAGQKVGRYAVKNVRERLELRYGKDFRLAISSEINQGTTVIVAVPVKIKESNYGNQIVNSRR